MLSGKHHVELRLCAKNGISNHYDQLIDIGSQKKGNFTRDGNKQCSDAESIPFILHGDTARDFPFPTAEDLLCAEHPRVKTESSVAIKS